MKTSLLKENYLTISFTYIALIIFVLFALKPSFDTAVRLNTSITELNEYDKQLSQKINSLSEAREFQFQYKEYFNLLDRAIPNSKNEDSVMQELKFIADKNNLALKLLEFDYLTDERVNVKKIKLNIIARGAFNDIFKFMEDTKKSLRIYDISSFKLTPVLDAEFGRNEFVDIQFVLNSYYY